jgi:uncharacterized protein (TIGR04255 family)
VTIYRNYPNSPITEALIDIRIQESPELTVEALGPMFAQIQNQYPKREDLMFFKGQFAFQSVPTASATQTKQGFRYRSIDGRYILQTGISGFTLSRLAPYESWSVFIAEAKRLWEIYRAFVSSARAVRVAVRSINRIDIPPFRELKDYFKTFPEISSELPQTLNGYVMQLLIAQPEFEGMLSLIQATVPAPSADVVSINLDIDLYKESTAEFDTDEKIWELLERLRKKKNEVFEGCITDKTRSLFGSVA